MSHFDFSDFDDSYTPSPQKFRENIENISMPSVSSFLHESDLFEASRITEVSDADNTLNCTDYLSKEIDEALKAKKLLDKDLVDEINDYKCLLKEVASARSKCEASKLVVQTIEEEFENSEELSSDLKKKCGQHMRFSNFLRQFKNSELLVAAGISDTQPVSLTCDEKQVVSSAIQKALKEKISVAETGRNANNRDLLNFSKNTTMPGSTLTEENTKVISLIGEINDAFNCCSEKTTNIMDTFNQLWNCRVQKFHKLHKQEMIHLVDTIKLVELEFKYLNLRIEDLMIFQSDDVETALDVLLRKLKLVLEENEFSLQKTEEMKAAYDQLKGTKFDEILKEYSEIRETMKHKQWALKQIQNQTQLSE